MDFNYYICKQKRVFANQIKRVTVNNKKLVILLYGNGSGKNG